MTTDPRQHPLRCQCGECRRPFAFVRNGVLVIESRHDREKHINVLTLEDVERLLKEMQRDRIAV